MQQEQLLQIDRNNLSTHGEAVLENMRAFFNKFSSDNPSIDPFLYFNQETKISEKSLRNWFAGKNAPYCQNIEAFYLDFAKLEPSQIPEIVLSFFERKSHKAKWEKEFSPMSSFFEGRRLHQLIYRTVKIGVIVKTSSIIQEFGNIGFEILKDLEQEKLITFSDDTITIGKVMPSPDADLYVTYMKNHVDNFPVQDHRNKKNLSDSMILNMFHEISVDYIDEMWREVDESLSRILNKFEEKTIADKKKNDLTQTTCIETSLLTNRNNLTQMRVQ